MSKKEKKSGLLKWLWNSFIDFFTLVNFSWVEREAEVLDKKFIPAHTERRIFYVGFITSLKVDVPDQWEVLVKVNDKKTFGPAFLSPASRNDTPCWASFSKEAFEKASKGDKVKVKCFISGQGMIYGVKGV